MTLGSHISAYSGAILGFAGKIVNVNMFVTVQFADGSSANLTISGITKENGKYKIHLTLTSAVDIDDNYIPLSAEGFQYGSYDFTIGGIASLQKFVDAAAIYGVRIYNPNNIVGRVYITDCDPAFDDKKGVCVAPK